MIEAKMLPKFLMLVLILLSLPVVQSAAPAASGLVGSAAPNFRVQSGDDRELTLDMIKGKVTALFYENKDLVENNKQIKDELNKLYFEQARIVKDVVVRLPVVDCSAAIWPFLGIWKRRVREHSKKDVV
jgi:hypothetical protein